MWFFLFAWETIPPLYLVYQSAVVPDMLCNRQHQAAGHMAQECPLQAGTQGWGHHVVAHLGWLQFWALRLPALVHRSRVPQQLARACSRNGTRAEELGPHARACVPPLSHCQRSPEVRAKAGRPSERPGVQVALPGDKTKSVARRRGEGLGPL